MGPERKQTLLWGLIGTLSFAVLYQAYVLAGAAFDWRVLIGGAVLVGAVTVSIAPTVERQLLAVRE